MNTRSPLKRIGKPPNILVLCDDANKRDEIGQILKNMLANDRYAVYDIRWDQLEVGGWSEQTALLVLAGNIPMDAEGTSSATQRLLQFLGDGGHLLSWCCETPPFGPEKNEGTESAVNSKQVLEYGPPSSQKLTQPLNISKTLWQNFQKIVETTDSEGYSRPLTASVWAKVKGPGSPAVILWDGGALGGKAVLSRVK